MDNSVEEEMKSLCGHKSDMPVCMNCILSNKLQDSHLELLSDICESLSVSKKDKIRKDLLDLEDNIGPSYDSNLGKVEELLSSVIKQHKDRKSVILDLGDELHKVVDLVINKYLSEAGKMEKEDIDFLQSLKSKFKTSASEIKAAIKEYREFLATDNNKRLAKYESKNEQFRKMPTTYDVTVTKFQPRHLTEDKLCQIIGVIPWSVRTEIKQKGQQNGAEAIEVDSSKDAKKESSSAKSKADKLSELNEIMDSISQATKDLVVALSPKVTRKLAVPKEFSTKVASHKEETGSSFKAKTVQCLMETKSKPVSSMNGHTEVRSLSTVQSSIPMPSKSKIPTPSSPKTYASLFHEKAEISSPNPKDQKGEVSSINTKEQNAGISSSNRTEQKIESSSPTAKDQKDNISSLSAKEEKVEISKADKQKEEVISSPIAKRVEISILNSKEQITAISSSNTKEQKVEMSSPTAIKQQVEVSSSNAREQIIETSSPIAKDQMVEIPSSIAKEQQDKISSPNAKSEITVTRNMEIDIPLEPKRGHSITEPAQLSFLHPSKEPNSILDHANETPPKSILKPTKEPNGMLDPRCHSEAQNELSYLDQSLSLLSTQHNNNHVTFSASATAELSKEDVPEASFASLMSDTSLDLINDVASPKKQLTPKQMDYVSQVMKDKDPLLEFFPPLDEDTKASEETDVFANAPWVMGTMETGYTFTYKIACARSTNQIFIGGNNKVIKQMTSEGKFVEKATTESGNQPFDLALTSDAQLMYSDHNGKCINIVRNNGKIENLIKFKKWFPMALCTTAANDLLVTMESEDLSMSKVVRYAGSTVKQEIQFNVKGEMLYCRADFIDENKNLDVIVSDLGARRIVVVDKFGIFRFNYTGNLENKKFKSFGCSGVTTTSKCHIIVADEYNDVLHVVDQNGKFLTYVDTCTLQRPGDLCTDSDDILYVTQPVANQVKKIKLYR